ncbi:MAG: hypothetical protein NZ809_01825 [Thermodesulfovibrio sp.]|nr:hypothetical protein [Thermodesulfovibrio sp.]
MTASIKRTIENINEVISLLREIEAAEIMNRLTKIEESEKNTNAGIKKVKIIMLVTLATLIPAVIFGIISFFK